MSAEVEVVLDKQSGIVYRCPAKKRRFVYLKDNELVLDSSAFCCVDKEDGFLKVGYEYLDPTDRTNQRLISEQENLDPNASFQAMLILNCVESVTPYTPTKVLFEVKGDETDQEDLREWVGHNCLERIRKTTPPEIARVSVFLKENCVDDSEDTIDIF